MSLFGVLGKIAEWVPSKKEKYRNDIESIKKQMSAIQSRSPYTTNDSIKYNDLADRLRQIESQYKNI